ncbi:DUF4097 family beta strand repeat-containing protein [Saccharothrix coeruleofusca]|uniref:DUF4097 domain-containing protein n=1 Tax=Saccharothrix coeruleofusca TaxID=33919 RepID=A0A918ASN5_9PSEU|nr:DUF4097 family beta strand repeat-containing protein [Saccharothrix coeruleofusca]MBP2336768.1 hypothetical protein [Saccharothrix coeruleofusca]GGP78172.1 hypothetical protein GCM10010185_59880 [Saccharothrix coeruleofusca]
MTEHGTALARRRIWLVTGAIVVTAAMVLGSLYLWSWVGVQTESQHQTYQREASRVEVDTDAVDVAVVAGQPGRVVVHRELSWSFGKPEVREVWDGGTLRVSAGCRSAPRLPGCSVRYRIEVPARTAVEARTSSGALSVDGLDGDLRLSTTSGSLTADRLGGVLWARASSGGIRATGLRSPEVDVGSTSGPTELVFAEDPRQVTASVRSGDFAMRVPPGTGPYAVLLSVKSGNRAVEVDQSGEAANRIDVESLSGDVRIQYDE